MSCSRAVEEGWVSAPFSRAVVSELAMGSAESQESRTFKAKASNIIQEYFLSDDIGEVIISLEDLAAPDYHAAFVKRLITLAMDRFVYLISFFAVIILRYLIKLLFAYLFGSRVTRVHVLCHGFELEFLQPTSLPSFCIESFVLVAYSLCGDCF